MAIGRLGEVVVAITAEVEGVKQGIDRAIEEINRRLEGASRNVRFNLAAVIIGDLQGAIDAEIAKVRGGGRTLGVELNLLPSVSLDPDVLQDAVDRLSGPSRTVTAIITLTPEIYAPTLRQVLSAALESVAADAKIKVDLIVDPEQVKALLDALNLVSNINVQAAALAQQSARMRRVAAQQGGSLLPAIITGAAAIALRDASDDARTLQREVRDLDLEIARLKERHERIRLELYFSNEADEGSPQRRPERIQYLRRQLEELTGDIEALNKQKIKIDVTQAVEAIGTSDVEVNVKGKTSLRGAIGSQAAKVGLLGSLGKLAAFLPGPLKGALLTAAGAFGTLAGAIGSANAQARRGRRLLNMNLAGHGDPQEIYTLEGFLQAQGIPQADAAELLAETKAQLLEAFIAPKDDDMRKLLVDKMGLDLDRLTKGSSFDALRAVAKGFTKLNARDRGFFDQFFGEQEWRQLPTASALTALAQVTDDYLEKIAELGPVQTKAAVEGGNVLAQQFDVLRLAMQRAGDMATEQVGPAFGKLMTNWIDPVIPRLKEVGETFGLMFGFILNLLAGDGKAAQADWQLMLELMGKQTDEFTVHVENEFLRAVNALRNMHHNLRREDTVERMEAVKAKMDAGKAKQHEVAYYYKLKEELEKMDAGHQALTRADIYSAEELAKQEAAVTARESRIEALRAFRHDYAQFQLRTAPPPTWAQYVELLGEDRASRSGGTHDPLTDLAGTGYVPGAAMYRAPLLGPSVGPTNFTFNFNAPVLDLDEEFARAVQRWRDRGADIVEPPPRGNTDTG